MTETHDQDRPSGHAAGTHDRDTDHIIRPGHDQETTTRHASGTEPDGGTPRPGHRPKLTEDRDTGCPDVSALSSKSRSTRPAIREVMDPKPRGYWGTRCIKPLDPEPRTVLVASLKDNLAVLFSQACVLSFKEVWKEAGSFD